MNELRKARCGMACFAVDSSCAENTRTRVIVRPLRRSYPGDTIEGMKVAISLPDPLFEAAEHLAQELQIPRSQLYAEALADYLDTHGNAAITAKLNEVHGATSADIEPALTQAQLKVIDREAW